jgi:hypothetical protein
MSNKTILSAILAMSFFLISCEGSLKKTGKVRSIGNTSEILVIVENDQQWEGSIGKAIRDHLGREQYGLNQSEPVFDLAHINKNSLSDLLRKHRNLLVVEIDPKSTKPRIESSTDIWSQPQQIIKIIAPDAESFVDAFNENASTFEEKYDKTERDRILSVFRTSLNEKALKNLKSGFGMKMIIPREFYVAKTEPGFMWVRKEVEKYSQGIIIISEPYQDTAQFSNASIIARLNRYMEMYIPGPSDGSYMKIDEEYFPPDSRLVNDFMTEYAVKTNGLWMVENDFMGGPFLSFTFVDQRDHNIVTLCGYVYQPNKKKRDLLRQVEAIMYSAKFI